MRRAACAVLLATVGVVPAAPAWADGTVVVPGTSFPAGSSSHLTWFACANLYTPASATPSAAIALDEQAPLGARAATVTLPAGGSAAGPVTRVGSVAGATWSMWVRPTGGGQGVGHVWYVSRELDAGEVWSGRADLTASPGGWSQVQPAAATYSWSRVDAATGAVLGQAGQASLDDFAAAHGDGPGYLLAGFGCDGGSFAVDAISAGDPGAVQTYDLEGLPVSTTIAASATQVAPGDEVTLTGATLDAGQRALGAALQLESRPAGAGEFGPVEDVVVEPTADGGVRATVRPQESTEFRWFQPTTGYADAGWSPTTVVQVGR